MAHAYLSERIVTPLGMVSGALLVQNGTIVDLRSVAELPADVGRTDFGAMAILPGLVDAHVHINEPGRTEWEGFRTATRAAAAGGFTTLVDMPLNCLPETTTVANLELKREAAAGQCLVDWAAWGGAVADNQAHILPLAKAGVPGFKCFLIYPGCDGFTMIDREQMEAALPFIAESGLPLLVHAELAGPIDAATAALAGEDWREYRTYLASRPDEAELAAIRMLINFCRTYRFRLHIVHLSTSLGLELIAGAKAERLPITVETCPHYLYFAAEGIPAGSTLHKCAPPIRSEENREGLWQGLRDGVIDLIATDHSPCPPEMKGLEHGRFDKAWGGIASLSLALSVVWTEASRRGFSLEDIARWMSARPALLAGLQDRVGALAVGREASFVVFDAEAGFVPGVEDLHFRHKVSPYVGKALLGRVRATYLRGAAVFGDGEFVGETSGRELRLDRV